MTNDSNDLVKALESARDEIVLTFRNLFADVSTEFFPQHPVTNDQKRRMDDKLRAAINASLAPVRQALLAHRAGAGRDAAYKDAHMDCYQYGAVPAGREDIQSSDGEGSVPSTLAAGKSASPSASRRGEPSPEAPSETIRKLDEAAHEALRALRYIEPAIPVLRTMLMTADLKLGVQKAEDMAASNREAIKKLEAVLTALRSPDAAGVREACAKVADPIPIVSGDVTDTPTERLAHDIRTSIATAIRAMPLPAAPVSGAVEMVPVPQNAETLMQVAAIIADRDACVSGPTEEEIARAMFDGFQAEGKSLGIKAADAKWDEESEMAATGRSLFRAGARAVLRLLSRQEDGR